MSESQSIIPMLSYEDGIDAMDWLVRVFGFVEEARSVDGDGRLSHGELSMGEGRVMLASPSPEYQSPNTLRRVYPQADKWLSVPYIVNGVLVYVEDVEAHYACAVRCGAKILSPVEDGPPGKRYRAEDLEGQRWFFMERS